MKESKIHFKPYRPGAFKIISSIIRFLDRFGGRTLAQDEEKLIRKARKKTGLQDFGDDSFREPLRILCELTRSGKVMSAAGRLLMKDTLLGSLMNKLKIQAEISAHPEILEEQIREPIIILGLPRTGSTPIQRLLALDPGFRTPRNWEMSGPVPPPEPETYETDPRIDKEDKNWKFLYYLIPSLKAIHESSGNMPEECIQMMRNDLISWWFILVTGDEYVDWLLDQDFTLAYQLHKRQLQLLQWKFPKKRWLLKAPTHIYGLSEMLQVYPDARVVQLHRDPFEVLPSVASLFTHMRGALYEEIDPAAIADEWLHLGVKLVERGIEVREKEKKKKDGTVLFHDILYPDFMADPIKSVRKMYSALGIELNPEAEGNMRRYFDENPQGKHGKHRYNLEQFGLDAKEIKKLYGPYCKRFGITTRA